MVGSAGLEPAATALKGRCYTSLAMNPLQLLFITFSFQYDYENNAHVHNEYVLK